MKIMEYGLCVYNGDSKQININSKNDLRSYKDVYDFNQNPPVLVYTKTDEELYVIWEKHEINQFAQDYIHKYYPQWKQSNIIREGSVEDIAKMGEFINAVRAWSNQTNPDPWNNSLQSIVP